MNMMLALLLSAAAETARAGESGLPDLEKPLRTGAKAPGDAGVVVGIADYGFVMDVEYAGQDAESFYDWLVYTRGVPAERVELLNSAGREKILGAVTRAAEAAGEDGGALWVYFSGHGAAHPETGERLLLGDDVKLDAEVFAARGVGDDELEAATRAAGVERALVVLDTCYTGLGRYAFPTRRPPQGGVSVWSATSGDQLALPLEEVGHGAFTYFALGALRGWADGAGAAPADGAVTLAEANTYVERALRAAQLYVQTPNLEGDDDWTLVEGRGLEEGPELSSLAPASSQAYLEQLEQQIAALQAAAQKEREEEEERQLRMEGAVAQLQGEATSAWALLEPALAQGDAAAAEALEGFVERYRDAAVALEEQRWPVEVPEVEEAEARLKALRRARWAERRVGWWVLDGGLLLTGAALSTWGRVREGQVESTPGDKGGFSEEDRAMYWRVNGLYLGGYVALGAGAALGVGLVLAPSPTAGEGASGLQWRGTW